MKKELKLSSYYFRLLFLCTCILSCIGLVFIFSSSSVYAAQKIGNPYYYLQKQIVFLIVGIAVAFFCALIPLKLLKAATPYLFVLSLCGLVLTFVPLLQLKVHGSMRWLSAFGFSVQPGEFVKVFLFLYCGLLLERRSSLRSSFWRGYIPFLSLVGVVVLLFLKQPDFGMAFTIFITALIVLFVAGTPFLYIAGTCGAALPICVIIISFASYRLNRILIFLNPWSDPQGKGYQIIQSLIAIGSGGVWGLGISCSRQKFFYLPMQHTDFIFSIIAEETGYVGAAFLIILYMFFLYSGMNFALSLNSSFCFLASIGFIMLLSLQALINIMVVSGLIPTKGLGLPFVSYGGSALICSWCMIGLMANFARNQID